MNHTLTTRWAGLISFLILLAGCKNSQDQAQNQAAVALPIATVQQSETVVTKEYAASIEGITNVEIRPQVSGYLEKILVDEGAYVKAGQVLFLIESSVYKEQYNNALANLTTAKIELDRKKELVKSKIVSDLQVQEAEATYNAAQAQAETAKINLNFCTIKAPVSGYISRIPYRLGSLVSPSNAEPLTFLSDIQKVNVYFSLSEGDFVSFQKQYIGNSTKQTFENIPPVSLILSDGEEYELKGKIDAIDGQFNKTTGAITLRAKFDNPKLLLRSGNTGKIAIEQKYTDAVLVPVASTIMIQDKVFIFSVDKDNKAVQLPIEVSGKSGGNYIVSKGIDAGDKYIVTGFAQLQLGTPVVAQKEAKDNSKPNANTQEE